MNIFRLLTVIIRTLAERVIARCVVRAVELQEAASC